MFMMEHFPFFTIHRDKMKEAIKTAAPIKRNAIHLKIRFRLFG